LPDHALYGGSKIVPQYLVEAPARDFGHRGVSVNSILPTAIKGVASTAGASDLVREFVRSSRPIARMGTLDDCYRC